MRGVAKGTLLQLLREAGRPAALAYGGLAQLRRWAHQRELLSSYRPPVPVISVGALCCGGTGKTPVTRLLAERLLAQSRKVAVVTGGYKGRCRGRPSRVDASWRWEAEGARRFGDESVLLADWLPAAEVWAGQDKSAACRAAVEKGADVVVLDDGFQHLRLRRDLDLVLLERASDAAIDLPRPAGFSRELPAALSQADLLWLHHRDGSRRLVPEVSVVSRNQPSGLLNVATGERRPVESLNGQRVMVLAGIARPAALLRLLERLGARIVALSAVADHTAFTPRLLARAGAVAADLLICTEKDAARMAGRSWCSDLWAICCQTQIIQGAQLLAAALGAALGRAQAPDGQI